MKPETEIDETGSFGEPEEKPAPFWKRSVWGISVATWGLCAVVLLAAIWYLFLRAPSETGMPPFNDADAGVQTWQTTQESSPSVQSTETMTVRTGEDMSQLARDVKTELDNRDEKIQATLNMLHDSINKLGEAIKKDEEYAQETRRQLDDIRSRLNGIMTQKSVTESSSTPHPAKKKTSSVLNGMKIMSMETGMAWIRWQGSTWAVREGQTLGNVVIQRIDPTIPVLRDNFNVPEFMLKRFLKMPEGPAPDGSGVPVLGVFRVKSGTLARILKFTVGPLELWALNSSPKDSALRKTLTNKLGSVRARKILAENFPRGSATSLIEHRAGQHNSDNVIEELASELIRKQGYNL